MFIKKKIARGIKTVAIRSDAKDTGHRIKDVCERYYQHIHETEKKGVFEIKQVAATDDYQLLLYKATNF